MGTTPSYSEGLTASELTHQNMLSDLRQQPLVWVGLIQAYLLMAIIAVLLALGSRDENPRKWNVVGALAHVPPLIAALSSLAAFAPLGASSIVWLPISFHLLFLLLEGCAALYPGR